MWILFCRNTTTISSNGSEDVWNHTSKLNSLVLKGLEKEKSDSYKEKAKNKIFPHFQSSGTNLLRSNYENWSYCWKLIALTTNLKTKKKFMISLIKSSIQYTFILLLFIINQII